MALVMDLSGDASEQGSGAGWDVAGFEIEKQALGRQPLAARIATEPPGGEHAMAWNDDRDGIGGVGLADGPRGTAQGGGELGVGPCFAVRDVDQGAPNALLKIGAARGERHGEVAAPAIEIREELCT